MSETRREDIVTVELARPLPRENVGTLLATGDEYANRFGAYLVKNGANVDVTGYTVTGSFIRPDTVTLALDGVAEGNLVYVDLPANCYVEDGVFSLAIKIVKPEEVTETVRMVTGHVRLTDTGNIIAPEETIITIDQIKGIANELRVTNQKAQALMEDLEDAADGVEQAIETASRISDILPYIGDNGNWYKWDNTAGKFVDSGIASRGEKGDTGSKGDTGEPGYTPQKGVDYFDGQPGSDGVDGQDGESITVRSVSESTADGGANVVTFSDGKTMTVLNGKTGAAGKDGKDGTGVTILGSYDSEAALKAAHPTGNPGDAYMVDGYLYVWSASGNAWQNVGKIQGPAGPAGADGYTPVKGKDYFDGKDGQPGKDGKDGYTPVKGEDYFDGIDGYTPQKGFDYWTETDRQEIINDVLAALPKYNGEVVVV